MSAADSVTVSIEVEVEPAVAFDVFTRELDAWWGQGPRFRFVAPYGGTLTLEPGVGGRLLHVVDAGVRLTNFTPEQQTRVDVRFGEPPAARA